MPGTVCYKCHKVPIVFDDHHISKTGKKIPLDARSGQPHICPEDDYNKMKKDPTYVPNMNTNASNTNNVTNQQEQRQQYWKERNELLDYRYEETKMWQQGVSEGIEELIVEQKVTNDLLRKLLQSKQNSRVTEGEAVAATEIAKRKESDTDDFEA